jgi:hypothetical protein
MKGDYRIVILQNDKTYIAEVKTESSKTIELINPMSVEYKFNAESMPVFRYVPWQILSAEPIVEIDKKNVIMMAKPKVEMLDVYQRICISFIPVESDDEE